MNETQQEYVAIFVGLGFIGLLIVIMVAVLSFFFPPRRD